MESKETLLRISLTESQNLDVNKINIVLFGLSKSGKTSLVNMLIPTFLKFNSKNDYQDYSDFLLTSCMENTYYFTSIESSDDEFFQIEHYQDDSLVGEILKSKNKIEISDYLNELEKDSTKILRSYIDLEVNNTNSIVIQEYQLIDTYRENKEF